MCDPGIRGPTASQRVLFVCLFSQDTFKANPESVYEDAFFKNQLLIPKGSKLSGSVISYIKWLRGGKR